MGRNTLALLDSGSTSTPASATGLRSPTGKIARLPLILLRPEMAKDSSVPNKAPLMSSGDTTLTPNTLTPMIAPSSTSASTESAPGNRDASSDLSTTNSQSSVMLPRMFQNAKTIMPSLTKKTQRGGSKLEEEEECKIVKRIIKLISLNLSLSKTYLFEVFVCC